MATQVIWLFLISLLVINTAIFIFVLARKLTMNKLNKRKTEIRKEYEEKFVFFLTSEDTQLKIRPETRLEKKVFQELIIDYNQYIPESKETIIINQSDKEAALKKVERYLNSSNIWKRKMGTYLAGEYRLDSLKETLLQQLNTQDNDLLFVTAKSLIKIADTAYLRQILIEVSSDRRMSKNQVLSLLELVNGNSESILNDVMMLDNRFLNVIALEEMGKRQYQSSVKWIRKAISVSDKELRIAALKASIRIGNSGDEDYLTDVLSLQTDPQWEVRAFLARFLKIVNTDESISLLKTYMSDENWHVRHNASESLFALEKKGRKALRQLLESEDPFARDAARAALQRDA